MKFYENFSLKSFNTFGIEANAHFFCEIHTLNDFSELAQTPEYQTHKKLFLGGGSNILLLDDFDGIVAKVTIMGIELQSESSDSMILKVGAGENWHQFVMYCVDKNYCGLENLSLIPGTVGAAPMQNIGAYGVEIKDLFESLEALNLETFEVEYFDKERCNFGYRESFFKHEGKDKYLILNVSFKLFKKPRINAQYGAINDVLKERGIENPSIRDVSNAVISIRKSKLPDPAEIGNSGSFFKNPEIPRSQYEEISKQFPSMPSYAVSENVVKVPAGWLIEQTGWKGFRKGDIGVHVKQALVLVNYGGGKGHEIKELAFKIQDSVNEKFGILIVPEVNFIS